MAEKKKRQGYRHLLMQLPAAVLVVVDGVIRFANRAAARLLGAPTTRALAGVEYSELVLSATPFAPGEGERLRLRRLDGQVEEAVAAIVVRRRSKIIVLREVSRGHATEAEIQQSQRMEAVGRLASGIAHDFNNLITAIHGHAQFLIEDMPEDNPSRSDAQEIMRSAERAAALTRQLLSFSRGRAVQPELVDLNHIVVSMENLLRRVITENIELVTILDPALQAVRADASQVEQVLVNLVVNARDAMPQGGTITIKTGNAELGGTYSTTHEEVEPGHYAMLVVADTGIGMNRDVQAHAFEPFFTTKEHGEGTGLGLSTVYSIVKQASGHVFLYSEPGQGTAFKIYLPVGTRETAPREPPRESREVADGQTVLVVEDDAAVRALAKRVLEARGYHVLVAGSGEDALEIVGSVSEPIALALIDHVLPDTSGAALAGVIRERRPDCQLMIMSGYTAEDVRRFGDVPADVQFIEKPFTPAGLAGKVRAVLDAMT